MPIPPREKNPHFFKKRRLCQKKEPDGIFELKRSISAVQMLPQQNCIWMAVVSGSLLMRYAVHGSFLRVPNHDIP